MLLYLALVSAALAAAANDPHWQSHSLHRGDVHPAADDSTVRLAEMMVNGTRVGNAIMYTTSSSHAEL